MVPNISIQSMDSNNLISEIYSKGRTFMILEIIILNIQYIDKMHSITQMHHIAPSKCMHFLKDIYEI